MTSLKRGSTSDKKSRASPGTNSFKETEPVIEGPAISYYRWVALAVAVIAIAYGLYYYFTRKAKTGLVFYVDVIAVKSSYEINLNSKCVDIVGGQHRAGELKTRFKSLSEKNKLLIIDDNTKWAKHNTADYIQKCLKELGIWDDFEGMYVLGPEYDNWQSDIDDVIKKTELDRSELRFISKPESQKRIDFLKANKLNIIEVQNIEELDNKL